MRILNYDTTLTWKPGNEVQIADMLSRSFPEPDELTQPDPTASVNMVEYLAVGDAKLTKLRHHTLNDESLQQLKTVIQQGWPETKQDVPNLVSPYYHIRDELSVQDGLIFRGERVVVPASLKDEMKRTVHGSHMGVEATLRRARECLYWPSMTADIREQVQRCETCRAFDTAQNQKETLVPHDTPSRPWEKVGIDLMAWDGKDYLVTVCYFSNFWELDRIYSLNSMTIIKKLKSHFARYGIPTQVVSDNGRQFVSEEFKEFAEQWDFEQYTISPKHSQANGKVESAVKSAKRLLNKCKQVQADPHLALLELRNVPSQGVGSSPAQRLHGRRTRTNLPISQKLLMPRGGDIVNSEREKIQSLKRKQSQRFNQHAKDLPPLEEDDVVRVSPYRLGDKQWDKGIVRAKLDQRSYIIETPHGLFRRNRIDLKGSQEDAPQLGPDPTPRERQSSVLSRNPNLAERRGHGCGTLPPQSDHPPKGEPDTTSGVPGKTATSPQKSRPNMTLQADMKTSRYGRKIVKPVKLTL
jgi:hypothetical protein